MKKYTGYEAADYQMPYAKFYHDGVAPAQAHVAGALAASPVDHLPPLGDVPNLLQAGYQPVETGYAAAPDGSLRVAVHTQMPSVLPRMWDWWFGWHGCRDNRYKIWHPLAHCSAQWQDGRDEVAYLGRTSHVVEYIGDTLARANVCFVYPATLGLPATTDEQVFICGRLGYTRYPLDFGWLVHQIRRTPDGAEMRSRFWLGGPHIQIRSESGWGRGLSRLLQRTVRLPHRQAADLLQHCAEEMNNLATFLPALYSEFKTP
jgi:hypothetical protein